MQTLSSTRPLLRLNSRATVAPFDHEDSIEVGETLTVDASSSSIDSMSILRGGKCVQIAHNGSVYLLQITKLGKLILTK